MPVVRIREFDTWRPGYAGATVRVRQAGTDTLASIYTDEALSVAASNPQTLATLIENGVSYGKFSAPLYSGAPYDLEINSNDYTGVERPALTTLDGEDASDATVRRASGSIDVALEDVLARTVYIEDFGEFLPIADPEASASTNNVTLNAAIAALSSGGSVIVPAGTFTYVATILPANVVIQGAGKRATVLRSTTAGKTITLSGDACGFRDLTLDGVSLVSSSIGVYSVGNDETVFERVRVIRFATGIYFKGGSRAKWIDFDVESCTTQAKLHGDLDTGNESAGGPFSDNLWIGNCKLSTSLGIDLAYVNENVDHNTFRLDFVDNAFTAFKNRGGRYTDLTGSHWAGNTTDIDSDDHADRTVIGLWVKQARLSGDIDLAGNCEDVVFERSSLTDLEVTITTPDHAVIARDCIEEDVTISGDGTKWLRWSTPGHGASSGVTTGASATKAWSIALAAGQRVILVARVIANGRNVNESAEYIIAVSARRPAAALAYDSQTANFTAGQTITGATSGATGIAVADSDSGTTGTLSLRNVVGTFVDNEIITDPLGGSATANGTQTVGNAALLGSVTSLRTAREDEAGWDATFAANGPEIELQVTGSASETIDWVADVDVTST